MFVSMLKIAYSPKKRTNLQQKMHIRKQSEKYLQKKDRSIYLLTHHS